MYMTQQSIYNVQNCYLIINKNTNAFYKDYTYCLLIFFFFSVGIGEFANFAAYAFAPASLVTPLGALSILVAAILSSKFLNEKLNFLGKIGCFLCTVGATIVVIYSPKEMEIKNLSVVLEMMQDQLFLIYCSIILVVSLFIGLYAAPRFGQQNLLWYIVLCSAVGSVTVLISKALSVAVRDTFNGHSNEFQRPITYLLILFGFLFIMIQMNYLNKALDTYNTNVVTPVYYVLFTTLVIVASAILFKEWDNMELENIIGDLFGFLLIIVAVFLLNAFKDVEITIYDVENIVIQQKEEKTDTIALEKDFKRQNSKDVKYGINNDAYKSLWTLT